MALFLFLIQLGTGLLLLLYYEPGSATAYESVKRISGEIPFGWLVRSIHRWSADIFIGVVALHMLTAFVMKAYRRPRELTWLTGAAMLGIALGFGFSGYLLPWDEIAFFATSVGTAVAGSVPVVGQSLLSLLARRRGRDRRDARPLLRAARGGAALRRARGAGRPPAAGAAATA